MAIEGAAWGRSIERDTTTTLKPVQTDGSTGACVSFVTRLHFTHARHSDSLTISQMREGVMPAETSKVGKRGAVVIPASLRRRFGITEGSLVIAEERAEGVLIRPAAAFPLEMYTPERQAEFLLSNAVDSKDYARAKEAVRKMGLDVRKIPHYKPVRS